MHWSKNKEIRERVLAKLSAAKKGKPSPRKGVTLSDETKRKIGVAQEERYRSGEIFGFQKGHPRFTKELHRFSRESIAKAHATQKANGTEGGRGTKRPYQTGPGHHNWKGGYLNQLWIAKRRSAMKKGAVGRHTREQWERMKADCNYTCFACLRTEPEITLTEDHIVPLSKGGSDYIENIQPLCRSCNTRKYTKTVLFIGQHSFIN